MLSDRATGTEVDDPCEPPSNPFEDTFWSFMKTYVMMIGEFEYEGKSFSPGDR